MTNPTSNSPGSFSYSVDNSNVAIVSGNRVTIQHAGTCNITATQADTADFSSNTISLVLSVAKKIPTLSNFNAISKTYGDIPFDLVDPSSNGVGAFTYIVDSSNVVSVNGRTVTIINDGTSNISAIQAVTPDFSSNTIIAQVNILPCSLTNPVVINNPTQLTYILQNTNAGFVSINSDIALSLENSSFKIADNIPGVVNSKVIKCGDRSIIIKLI